MDYSHISYFFKYYFLFILIIFTASCTREQTYFNYSVPKIKQYNYVQTCDFVLKNGKCVNSEVEFFEINPPEHTNVDIVFILDVSNSNSKNLEKLSSSFLPLISSIKNLNWQIAFTTADHGDHNTSSFYYLDIKNNKATYIPDFTNQNDKWENYRGYKPEFGLFMNFQKNEYNVLNDTILTPYHQNYEQIFKHTISRDYTATGQPNYLLPPYSQGAHKQPLRVLKSIIERSRSTQPHINFFREKSHFISFIITDEDERSNDPNRRNITSAEDILREFRLTYKDSNKKFIAYGIHITNKECLEEQKKNNNTSNKSFSPELYKLVEKTNGINISICDSDYSKGFQTISKKIRNHVSEIPLKKPALSNLKIEVFVLDPQGLPLTVLWSWDKKTNSIHFEDVENSFETGVRIEVQYYTDPDLTPYYFN